MKVRLTQEYKSFNPFESEELNDFTVVIGKNGSGKTQITELFRNTEAPSSTVSPSQDFTEPRIRKVQFGGLDRGDYNKIDYETWKKRIEPSIKSFEQLGPLKYLLSYLHLNKLIDKINDKEQDELLVDDNEYYKLVMNAYLHRNMSPGVTRDQKPTLQIEKQVLSGLYSRIKFMKLLIYIAEYYNKAIADITAADFYRTPITENFIDYNALFSSKIELIYYNYAKRRDQNARDFFEKSKYGYQNKSVDDDEFTEQFPPPWTLINKIFEYHKIDYYFDGLPNVPYTIEVPIEVKLIKKSTGKPIQYSHLSSGEKIIISLIEVLFNSEYYGNDMTFPELVIFDEPDAHLHPEMTKLLLDVLEQTFVQKFGVKVIITTHSPSTIALAPEDSIFEVRNGKESSLKKISKDDALRLLTGFIPTLSIDYKNHKQVFLESPTDVAYFQTLHDKHQQNVDFKSRLYFISNGYGDGNCDLVYNIVNDIRKSGNNTVYGIVDWDLKNKPKNEVYVHGYEERYSVENFILDPIYLISLLLHFGNPYNIMESIGVDKTYNQLSIGEESNERLQSLTQVFFEKFEKEYPAFKYDTPKKTIYYSNNKSIEIPIWYLEMKGHDIDIKLKKIFPILETKFRNEGELQKELTIVMAKLYPFVPMSSINLIEEILAT